MMSGPDGDRVPEFQANPHLNQLLREVNENLKAANKAYAPDPLEQYRPVFIVGAPRSGTTLFMQWLASTGLVAYPTNLLSRFYGAPFIGAKIQQLLTDPLYGFQEELFELEGKTDYSSNNGKTRGALAPNEFWFFWRRFLHFEKLDYAPDDELRRNHDIPGLAREINGLANIFGKPFASKALILNQNIPVLAEQFVHPLFIWVKRDPVMVIQSILEARKRQYGDEAKWYSFKIREYPELADLPPIDSIAGQVAALDNSISTGFRRLPSQNKLTLRYEELCNQPEEVMQQLHNCLGMDHIGTENSALGSFTATPFKEQAQWRLALGRDEVRRMYEEKLVDNLDEEEDGNSDGL